MKTQTLLVGLLTMVAAATSQAMTVVEPHPKGEQAKATTMPHTIKDLMRVDQKVGTGTEARPPAQVTVHYTGWLYDPAKPNGHGAKFDSSLDRGEPFSFRLGGGQVIRGWDEGVAGMKVGGTRTLIIPPHLGYGARGAGSVIPPYATLVFDIELLSVR